MIQIGKDLSFPASRHDSKREIPPTEEQDFKWKYYVFTEMSWCNMLPCIINTKSTNGWILVTQNVGGVITLTIGD